MDSLLIETMVERVGRLRDAAALAGERRIIVGIFGPPGAGKSTAARALVETLNDGLDGEPDLEAAGPLAAYVPMDGFHLSNAQLDRLGRRNRKGAPDTFDSAGYASLLRRLSSRPDEDIYVPDYSRELHEPVAQAILVASGTHIIATEGNYLGRTDAAWATAREFINELWFLDAPDSVLERRLLGRRLSHGDSIDGARAWIVAVDMPNVNEVRTTSGAADVVYVEKSAGWETVETP